LKREEHSLKGSEPILVHFEAVCHDHHVGDRNSLGIVEDERHHHETDGKSQLNMIAVHVREIPTIPPMQKAPASRKLDANFTQASVTISTTRQTWHECRVHLK
jgi:hypothetical protein